MDLNDYLKSISFNSSISNLEEHYASLAPKLDLRHEVLYNRRNDNYTEKKGCFDSSSTGVSYFTSLFHFSLSVKVFTDSRFIPFKFIDFNDSPNEYTPNEDRQIQATKYVDELVAQGATKYNYADFLSEVSARYPKVSSVSFDTEKNENGDIVIVANSVIAYGADQSELKDVVIKATDFDNLLLPQSFAMQFSYVYLELMGIQERLRFSLYAFDSDAKTASTKLTHFITITPNINPSESQPFFYNYVRTIRDIASRIRTKHIQNLVQKTRFEAIKSAISAIMSRNMSHNLGSHYLYYTKANLEKIAADFIKAGDQLGFYAPDVKGAAKVLGYVQGRMDYLATLISHDKYPYGSVNFKTHIWDELTIDDFSARHFREEQKKIQRTTNYLLTNLILSENFTRRDVRKQKFPIGRYALLLNIKLQDPNSNNHFNKFTGGVNKIVEEEDVKRSISQMYLALPGGIMSCHAFFNVVENFIRNSAKYLQADFKSMAGTPYLNFTIAIRRNPKNRDSIDFVIYDNKENANRQLENGETLYNSIVYNTLGKLCVIDDSGHIEKEAKGFKEMLFSAAWMRSYMFGEKTYADIITQINETDTVENLNAKEDSDDSELGKIDLIEKYGFKVVQVVETRDKSQSVLTIIDRRELKEGSSSLNEASLNQASLGIVLTIPEFKQATSWTEDINDSNKTKQSLLNIYADIVSVPIGYEFSSADNPFKGCFPRAISSMENATVLDKFKAILRRRFSEFDKYCLVFDERPLGKEPESESYKVFFKRHMNTATGDSNLSLLERYKSYAYADTVSGGNFTITLEQLCLDSWDERKNEFCADLAYFPMKVMESALTRITVIDERLFNNSSYSKEDLSLKNLRVLNYNMFEDRLSDVLSMLEIWMSNVIRDAQNSIRMSDILKTLYTGLKEAYCSVKHTTDVSDDAHNQFVAYQRCIKEYVENSALDLKRKINEYSTSLGSEREKYTFPKGIINYVDSQSQSKLAHAEALHSLLKPIIDKIREKTVSEVNQFANGSLFCILQGNTFRDGKDDTLFLSIHLGLIEKMLKNSEWLNTEISRRMLDEGKKQDAGNRLDTERVETFMNMLKESFGSEDTQGHKEVFISVHSGRGNFSKELEGALKQYPFITLSALENAFNNCKYLLCQLFYNTVYIGKGVANENS